MQREQFNEIMSAPVAKDGAFSIEVKRIYTDVNGTVVDKSAAVSALQSDFPVYMLGEYDRLGAYYSAQKNLPLKSGYDYLNTFVWGYGMPFFFGFNPLSNIQLYLKPGDIVTVFTDSLTAPNNFVFIVLTSSKRSIASLVANTKTELRDLRNGRISVKALQYFTDNQPQWYQTLQVLKSDILGDAKSDNIEPYLYQTPKTFEDNFIQIDWNFVLNQYVGINTYMLYATDRLYLNFIIKRN